MRARAAALFARVGRAGHRSQAHARLVMRACTIFQCSTCSHRRYRLAAAGTDEWQLLGKDRRHLGLQRAWLDALARDPIGTNLFRDAAACVSRERVAQSRPLSAVYRTAVVEVDVCVALEPHRLVKGSANVPRMAMACAVVGPVAVGCFRAGSTVILRSRHFLSLFRLSGAATRHEFMLAVVMPTTIEMIICWPKF